MKRTKPVPLTAEDQEIYGGTIAAQTRGADNDDEREAAAMKEAQRRASFLGPIHRVAEDTIEYEQEHGFWGQRKQAKERRK